jgi:hypothetical protein
LSQPIHTGYVCMPGSGVNLVTRYSLY